MAQDGFVLTDLISSDILQKLQDAFSEYVGMAALTTDANGTPVTKGSGFTRFCMELTRKSEAGCRNCEACDRQGAIMTLQSGKPAVYECHAGLVDYAAPILLNGEFIGSFIGGQVRSEPVDVLKLRKIADVYEIDPDEYVAAAEATNQIPLEQIERSAKFLSQIAEVLSDIAYQRWQTLRESAQIEQTARSQSDMVAKLSGDLKARITDLAKMIQSASNGTVEKGVESLMNQTIHLGTMVGDTMDYMQIMNGGFELHEVVYDVRQVVERKVAEYQQAALKQFDILTYQIAEQVPAKLLGDPVKLGQIVGKLIENSIRYTKNAGIHVEITSKPVSYAEMLTIRVKDGGVGIEEKQAGVIRSYMMSRGKAGREAVPENEEFLMLGFSLIGHCVNAMSGRIQVESALGEGTIFTVRLPQLAVAGA